MFIVELTWIYQNLPGKLLATSNALSSRQLLSPSFKLQPPEQPTDRQNWCQHDIMVPTVNESDTNPYPGQHWGTQQKPDLSCPAVTPRPPHQNFRSILREKVWLYSCWPEVINPGLCSHEEVVR